MSYVGLGKFSALVQVACHALICTHKRVLYHDVGLRRVGVFVQVGAQFLGQCFGE